MVTPWRNLLMRKNGSSLFCTFCLVQHTHTHTHTSSGRCCSVTVMKDAVQSLYWFGVFKGSDTIIIIIIIISPSDGRCVCVCVRSRVSASIICLGPFPRSQLFELFQPSIICLLPSQKSQLFFKTCICK